MCIDVVFFDSITESAEAVAAEMSTYINVRRLGLKHTPNRDHNNERSDSAMSNGRAKIISTVMWILWRLSPKIQERQSDTTHDVHTKSMHMACGF